MSNLCICFYTDVFLPSIGGAQTVLHHLATECSKLGIRVVVLAPAPKRRKYDDSQYAYDVVRFKAPRSKKFGNRLRLIDLYKVYRKYRFNVLHCHAAYPQTFVARELRRWMNFPVICRPHGSDIVPEGGIRKSDYATGRMRKGLDIVDRFIAQCRYMADVMEDFGISSERINIINNGVSLEDFSSVEPFKAEKPYAISVANLIPRKGFDIMLKAFAKLERKDIEFRIVGRGDNTEKYEKLAEELGIADRVIFHGPKIGGEKIALLKGATVFLSASRKEPYSNSLLEAMAAGLPVIASAVDGCLEMVTPGVNGWLFPSEDIDAMAHLIEQAFADRPLMQKTSASTIEYIAKHDWPIVAQQYIDLYREALGSRTNSHK
ncbi:glycosyltransferase family 4 protein [Hahella aquimaris]|uniref:glycosyltransferase family 4 protein n=1 Tax=Hahella sp. HNIBRBA332 TaxID=3015983 RepID=UPI00273B5369|nr:glycosyltransferase family 4 protein [Hahella sp. HNIBRBA332]WLQ12215.1 glycosyltransferase family 4 protein [Hahella sp. HNIBRBA332]